MVLDMSPCWRAEKNLEALKQMLERLPSNACLCFVGDGPSRPDLAKHFEGLPVYFTVGSPCSCLSKPCHETRDLSATCSLQKDS